MIDHTYISGLGAAPEYGPGRRVTERSCFQWLLQESSDIDGGIVSNAHDKIKYVVKLAVCLYLFLILASGKRYSAILQLLLQKLIYRERHRLTRRNAHNSRRNALVERMESFLSIQHLISTHP